MASNLLIVESPAKAKTIEKYLGKNFTVKSCFGHIRDLEKENMGIDVNNNFKPRYIISEDKEKVVKELKALVKKSDEVWLATDEDREGEAISWHLCDALNLDVQNTKRIVFHEITKPAILKAVETPRVVDMNLVDAQQARRVLDRLVGFKLSPLLSSKMNFQMVLSAGRVQSVAVKLVVERKKEIDVFKAKSFFDIKVFFNEKNTQDKIISFSATRPHFKNENEVKEFLESCKNAIYKVNNIEIKAGKKSPSSPFTTSTLQQEASIKLGYSVKTTMMVAQKLYENGLITYMRTDSINLSSTAIVATHQQIKEKYGEKYLMPRNFRNKNKNSQEAHEAIRPTDMKLDTVVGTDGKKLYELIWKRTMACQMADAVTEKTIVDIAISTRQDFLKSEGEVIKFEGFLAAYNNDNDEDNNDTNDEKENEKILPPLTVGQILNFKKIIAKQKFTKPPASYSEATLVKKLEELGIGRPSTYASAITTIINRRYVIQEDRLAKQRGIAIYEFENNQINTKNEIENYGAEKKRLYASDLGVIVTNYLSQHFEQIMDYKFTANVEEELDKIAEGAEQWERVVRDFYIPFDQLVNKNKDDDTKINSEKYLGIDPKTKKDVFARMARYGPVVQLGRLDDEDKPIFANLKVNQSLQQISLEEALELFTLPKKLGTFDGSDIIVNVGRYGSYLSHNERSYSLIKDIDPYDISLEKAIEIIKDKSRLPRVVGLYEGKEMTVNVGRYGPYVLYDDNFYSIKKVNDIYSVGTIELINIIKEQAQKKEANTLKEFPMDKIKILKGRFGPYIKYGRMNLKMHKDLRDNIDNITADDIKKYAESLNPTKAKKNTKTKKIPTSKITPAKKKTNKK